MIKLVVSDLDGTLLKIGEEFSKGISSENIDALIKLNENNIDFAIASARDIEHRHFINQILLKEVAFAGMNGAQVYVDGDVWMGKTFDPCLLYEFNNYLKNQGFAYNIITDDINHKNYTAIKNSYPFIDREKISNVESFNVYYDTSFLDVKVEKQLLRIGIFLDPKYVSKVKKYLIDTYKEFDFTLCDVDLIDTTYKGINKGSGVKKLCEMFSCTIDEVAVIGDNENDISMFNVCPMSFCMDHANDDILSHAAYKVKSVAQAIEIILKANQKEKNTSL